MTTTKRVFCGVVFAIAIASGIPGSAQSAGGSNDAKTAERHTATRKGVIKTISDASVVVVPSDNKKVEVTYQLTADTKRAGALAAGDSISVTYYIDKAQPVATALTGKSSAK